MQKVQKTYSGTNSQSGSGAAGSDQWQAITHVARYVGDSRIPRSQISGAESWLNTTPKPFQAVGTQTTQEEEVRRLKRELDIVKQERDRIKKL